LKAAACLDERQSVLLPPGLVEIDDKKEASLVFE
jgi:hypothetical protein